MMVLLGGSGSGKTTLLNALAGRLGSLPILGGGVEFVRADRHLGEGSRGADGEGNGEKEGKREKKERERDERGVGRRIGFVRQNDHLLPHLTVRETLEFSAALRLPRSVTNEERKAIIEQTIQGPSLSLRPLSYGGLVLTASCSSSCYRTRSEGCSRHRRRRRVAKGNLGRGEATFEHRLRPGHAPVCLSP
jgi:ABC-type glutathione transport system ATPase component